MNILTEDESDVHVSIGIDYGDVLLIGGPDYFGHTVTRASKLEGDFGNPKGILVNATAFNQI